MLKNMETNHVWQFPHFLDLYGEDNDSEGTDSSDEDESSHVLKAGQGFNYFYKREEKLL